MKINNILLNKIMYWKILIVLVILSITIFIFLFGQLMLFKETAVNGENDTLLQTFLTNGGNKISIAITKEKFDSLIIPEDMVLYYFPDICPEYTVDIFLVTEKDGMEKYYLPEKNCLILIGKEHKWTNSFDKYTLWKK